MGRLVFGALSALLVGGCGLVLDLGPEDDAGGLGGDGGVVWADGGASMDDAGASMDDAGASMDASVGDAGAVDASVGDAGAADGSAGDAGSDAGTDACVPALEICNGVDDDCNGIVDEGCTCARYVLAGGSGAGLYPDDPMGSIQGAIDSMATTGETGDVCVAATLTGGGCSTASYAEAVAMSEGVSVLGGYRPDPGRWDRTDPACETVIDDVNATGVLFGHTITDATRLDGFTVHGLSGVDTSAAITVQAGGTISGNLIYGGNTASTTWAIRLEACDTAMVRILENREIVGALEGNADAYGIASSDCILQIEGNGTIAGRSGGNGDSWGIHCEGGSTCTVVRNGGIVGIAAGATGGWGRAVMIDDASTGDVLQNGSIAGCSGAASWCIAVVISDTTGTPLVDRNVVEPSMGSSWTSGILVRRANATVSNNLVVVDGGNGIELALNRPDGASTEATVHSNTVIAPPSPASSRTVRLLLADYEGTEIREPNGIFRNNIAACLGTGSSRYAFSELGNSGKPRIFENNDLFGCGTMYALSTGSILYAITGVNALPGANGNMSLDPLFVSPPSDLHLQATSPMIDAGTSSGTVPPHDFDGESRPRGSGPDVGFDEAG